MIKKILRMIFGTRNDRLLKGYQKIVAEINSLEAIISKLSDAELKAKTGEFKERYKNGQELSSILPEAFAVCREASARVLNMRHFDVQLIGGMVLNDGKIAEMRTGEGKTLVGTLATYLNAITGLGVHVVTVNDYLARRDAEDMGKLYNFLGVSVGINLPEMSHEEKSQAYRCDITYGTNNEFGFDYLRDNMVFDENEKVQRSLNFAVVDEVDSILIDEARTPLIISGPAEDALDLYVKLNQVPEMLVKQLEDGGDGDFWVDEKDHNVILSDLGHEKVEGILVDLGILAPGDSLYHVHNISLLHHLLAALKAHYVYIRDQHYVVQKGDVVIVDEFTGRLMAGRRWSDGLHQAVEAKEGVEIQRENQTMASITFQNYFRMYKKLSGMTGTADTEAYEFQQIYALETVVIPTNNPMIRIDHNDKIYMNIEDKYNAIIEDIRDCQTKGQPVLVGTTSVENSEVLSSLLKKANLKHEVLNAKQNEREAEIIMQAGSPSAITVATNMAGRGTDIILGGGFKPLVLAVEQNAKLTVTEKNAKIKDIMQIWEENHQKVLDAGGLYIIGTERHESRRIDNQLRGRSGRQGDPGASRFYLSLDDPLLRIFGGERMRGMMQRLGMEKGEAIEHKWLSRSIESAQRKVEGHNFDIRKQLLEYDDVSNDQRRVIYQQRDEVLTSTDLSKITINMIDAVIGDIFDSYIPPKSIDEMWDVDALEKYLEEQYGLIYDVKAQITPKTNMDSVRQNVIVAARNKYLEKMADFAQKVDLDVNGFMNNTITESGYDLVAIDNFCAQNNMHLEETFSEYVAKNPNISVTELKGYFKSVISAMGKTQVLRLERNILLQNIDQHWREHLTNLEQLRQGIHLRGYAQKDPKQEYRTESFALFSGMLDGIKSDAAKMLLALQINGLDDIPSEEIVIHSELQSLIHESSRSILSSQNDNSSGFLDGASAEKSTPSRNSPCPCGSGKKYKHCHGKL